MTSTPARPPSVERLLRAARPALGEGRDPEAVTDAARGVIAEERVAMAGGGQPRLVEDLAVDLVARLRAWAEPRGAGLTPVINATGVLLHTNLGRAAWPRAASEAAALAASSTSLLELDRATGRRGARFRAAEAHLVALTGAGDALVTNNNAAALALAVGLAGRRGVAVSRGELVEIGGGVRIPEIVRRAGARLVEVGTTNRTRAADFADALADGRASVVLRVHPSNFRQEGFTEVPDPAEVAAAAHARGAIVIDDLGSGALLDTARYGLAHEPTPRERLEAGADLVTFSGDKLLGGPQAGPIVGRADLVARLRRDPLARAVRPDKVTLAALAATLGLYRAGLAQREIPVWRAIAATPAELDARAAALQAAVTDARVTVRATLATVGGGSLPGETLPSVALAVAGRGTAALLDRLRVGEPAVVGRIEDGAVLLDLRSVHPEQDADLARALCAALAAGPGDRARVTVVIGTAGHIDHGKTTLLRALTGIDADRLPEEQRRGMTIDVGYAHLSLPDGTPVDFVDVPGHDRLVGNMLVGAGEIDAALLVVAADDGPRAQTLEHLALLDALGIADGLIAITKADLVPPERVAEVVHLVERLLAPTGLAGAPIHAVSGTPGRGMDGLRTALAALVGRVAAGRAAGAGVGEVRLAVDRAFAVKGRGAVVTGSLRGGTLAAGAQLRLVPGDRSVRVREVQVHGAAVAVAGPGRTALNLAGIEAGELARGMVLTADASVLATDRLLVAVARPRIGEPGRRASAWPPRDGARARLHLGTADAEATVGRGGRDALTLADGRAVAVLRLSEPVAAAAGDRFVLRRPSPGSVLAGGVVLDARPARGVSRRRQTPDRVDALAAAVGGGSREEAASARLVLHGVVTDVAGIALAADVTDAGRAAVSGAVSAWHVAHPADPGMPLPAARTAASRALRRLVTLPADASGAAADAVIAAAVTDGALVRDGDRVRTPAHRPAGPDPALLAAMDRLEAALAVSAPPPLAATAAAAGCTPDGIRALEKAGRIVVLEPDLAWAATTYRELAAWALMMAHRGPLTPAAYRDATGTSRRFGLVILEDLDRRGILRRTDAGHVPGPKAPPLPARSPRAPG